jgi:hypothetical protein
MPPSTLVATAGASNANAYVTLAVADQYHLDRPAAGTTWSSASADQKTAAILWATKLLDALYEWRGSVAGPTQALLWPRVGMYYRSGYGVDPAIIPAELQQACAEFARQLLVADRAGDSDVETQGITSLRAGSVALTFKDNVHAKTVPDAVVYLIPRTWGSPRGRLSPVRDLVRA